jgi:HEXXH motif-containing protein
LITTHSLSAEAFEALGDGAGDSVVVGELRGAQLSKNLMLLGVIAKAAEETATPETAAFLAGYRLLGAAQYADPRAVATLLSLPHIGSWAHDCLAGMDKGTPPDFGYLAAVAVAAAVPLGIPFDLDAPVRDGRVPLPGLGCLRGLGQDEWIRLRSDGTYLHAGRDINLACAGLVPAAGQDDSQGKSKTAVQPHWQGSPLVRASAGGQTWEVLLEIADSHLDRYTLPMLTVLTEADVAHWRQLIQSAWELLVGHHQWAAGPIARGVPVIVPLVPRTDLDSATSPAAFGAVATSVPPSTESMAETLVHEFQHTKLCGLMDMLPLIEPTSERGYAPWREDPRPLGGILQGAYAFAGIVRFWDVQRRLKTEHDDILRASVLYERWRQAIELTMGTLLESGLLTAAGIEFVTALRERGSCGESAAVSAEAMEIASEVALDNWLTWQLRHTALDTAAVAVLAAAYRQGESPGGMAMPAVRFEDDIRKVDSIVRSRLLNMRCQEPARYRQVSTAATAELGAADALLIGGQTHAAVAAYSEQLSTGPDPAAWIGLALAVNRLPAISSRQVFATRLPLLFEVHACLADQGIRADPLKLAAWFG